MSRRVAALPLLVSVALHAAAITALWSCMRLASPRAREEVAVEQPIEVDIDTNATVMAAPNRLDLPVPSSTPRRSARGPGSPAAATPARGREPSAARPPSSPPQPQAGRVDPTEVGATPTAVPAPTTMSADLRLRRDPSPAPSAASRLVSPPTRNLPGDASEAPVAELPIEPGQVIERPGFRAKVARDGSISFDDPGPGEVDSDLLSPGKLLGEWRRNPVEHARERDGTLRLLHGSFDITDAVMRALGQDPYRVEREKVLDATRAQRMVLGARARSTRRRAALEDLPRLLGAIWADDSRSWTERRRLLFQVWDECEEGPAARPGAVEARTGGGTDGASDEGSAARAGEQARARIVAFIRATLPATSPVGYTAPELAQLNAGRESRQRFQPYASVD